MIVSVKIVMKRIVFSIGIHINLHLPEVWIMFC